MGFDTENHWLSRKRFLTYTRVFFLVYLILALGVVAHSNLVKQDGFPLYFDFAVFWSASKLTLLGLPSQAYDLHQLHQVLHALQPEIVEGSYGWFYPPSYLLLISQLARLPYLSAYLVFMGTTLALFAYVIRKIGGTPQALWALAGFSGVWDNLLTGQNGFLTAAIAGGSLLLLDKRPVIAGLLAGILSIKPQLAVLFPVAFIASKSWNALIAAALSSVFSIFLSSAIFGFDTLTSWLHSLSWARAFLEIGGEKYWMRMPTIFASAHLLGASVPLSYFLHLVVSCCVAVSVWLVWSRSQEPLLRNAVLASGTLLISPYILIYDLTWLALPMAWLARYALERGWLRWEREVLVFSWFVPLIMLIMGKIIPIQIGFLGALSLLVVACRRVFQERRENVNA